MRQLGVFNFLSLNGFYKGVEDDISWHRHGAEEGKFSEEGLASGNVLLFGRKTYEMMASFWPHDMAFEAFPKVAEGMNRAEKVVASRTLKEAPWTNTRIIGDNLVEEVCRMKETGEKDITILGSGSLVTQLAEAGLVDSFQFMIDPVALGEGTPAFSGLRWPLGLELSGVQTFESGTVVLSYRRL